MSKRLGITPRQAATLAFIRSYEAQKGCCPSYDEIKDHLGLRSKSSVYNIVDRLEERGHIVRLADQSRSISMGNAPSVADMAEEIARLREALEKCRERFIEYRDAHMAKGTEDGEAKAFRNAEMVEICGRALNGTAAALKGAPHD